MEGYRRSGARPTRKTLTVNPKSLLLVSQPTSGGVAVCVHDLARHAASAGIDVTVASPDTESLPRWLKADDIPHVELDMRRAPGLSDLSALTRLRRLMSRFEVVHFHSSKAGALGRIAALSIPRRQRPRILFTPHAWSWLVGGRLATLYRMVEKALAGTGDGIIAVSEAEAETGRRVLGRRARIFTIPNGVDTTKLSPRGSAGGAPEDPILVCVGRLARQKGQDVAIEALASLPSNVRLRLVGDGPEREQYEAGATAGEVDEGVQWVGRSAEPFEDMRAADIVVIPSRWDGLSLVLLEAMAVGSAIVATRVSGSEAAAGVAELVTEDDPGALAEAIDKLLKDPLRLEGMRSAARERSLQYDITVTRQMNLDAWRGSLEPGDELSDEDGGQDQSH